MLEKEIEKKLVSEIKKRGGRAYKFVSPGNDGVPDRLVILPGGKVIFAELKTDTGKLSSRQQVQIDTLKALGCGVVVIKGEEGLNTFLRHVDFWIKMQGV